LDIFIEQLVTARKSPKRLVLKLLSIILPVLAGLSIMLFTSIHFLAFTLLLFIGFCWLAWYLSGLQNIEYEYSLTNNDLDIDKITAKRSRKRLITIKVTTFTDYRKADGDDSTGENVKLVDVSGQTGDVYIADCSHDKIGKIELRFTPNEDFSENLEKVFPRELKLKLSRQKK
jgi:hypothetical protein